MSATTTLTASARPSLKTEVALGYLLQVVSVLLLLAQHFFLPVYLGLEVYGLLSFTIGSASLLFCAYDHGYNLLTIKKPSLGHHYLAAKLAILSLVALAFYCYSEVVQTLHAAIMVPVLLYALCFVVYTFLIHYEIAAGKLKRVLLLSVANGVLLLVTPIVFASAQVNISYAPAVAALFSLFIIAISQSGIGLAAIRKVFSDALRLSQIRKSFVKQGQISLGIVIDGTIVWLGVVVVSTYDGFESAAIYRIVMSAVALLTQIIPLPKQVLLRVARTSSTTGWAVRYAAALLLVGMAQVFLVYFLGNFVVSRLFPVTVEAIYSGVLLLSLVPALKAIFDLETILFDRANGLPRLTRNVLIAGVLAAVAFVKLDMYWTILLFYCFLSAISASAFLMKPAGTSSKAG